MWQSRPRWSCWLWALRALPSCAGGCRPERWPPRGHTCMRLRVGRQGRLILVAISEEGAMSGFCYYLVTFAESIASIFGIRSVYEQPRYEVLQHLGQSVEIRRYEPRVAIEAVIEGGNRDRAANEAFGLLFRYITGANRCAEKIAMTAPVQTASSAGTLSMRFYLPRSVAEAGAPAPLDPRLHLVDVPAATVAVLRYSGVDSAAARTEKGADLLA